MSDKYLICPTCKKSLPASSTRAPAYPFCSERCQLADLGRWLDGDYAIADEANLSVDHS